LHQQAAMNGSSPAARCRGFFDMQGKEHLDSLAYTAESRGECVRCQTQWVNTGLASVCRTTKACLPEAALRPKDLRPRTA
jgi:hypothetical protein